MRAEFSILNYTHKTDADLVKTVQKLGGHRMRVSSHGFEIFGEVRIIEAARKQAATFAGNFGKDNAAIMLMSVVLAANRNFNKQVQPHVQKLHDRHPNLTFRELSNILSVMDYRQFKDVWGHKDKKKYETLTSIVQSVLMLDSGAINDYGIMRNWAANAKLNERKKDPIGRLRYVGIATFQHLRMVFGVDTVKPDQRVKEVLLREFGAKLSDEKAILAVEEIAHATGFRVAEIDQIFVKYGSGYYLGTERSPPNISACGLI